MNLLDQVPRQRFTVVVDHQRQQEDRGHPPSALFDVGVGKVMRLATFVVDVDSKISHPESQGHDRLAYMLTLWLGQPQAATRALRAPDASAGARCTATAGALNSCFVRSGPQEGRPKALVKITQRCDLRAHCFVSATRPGSGMPAAAFTSTVMSRF